MAADSPIPLATTAQLKSGAFADLVRNYPSGTIDQAMIEATRELEGMCSRRLAPFTLTETHRAEGIDPDEYTDSGNMPLDIRGAIGMSYATALGSTSLVRQVWLNEYAPRHPEYWTYSNVAITIVRSYGGSQTVTTLLDGPDPDSGHVWFQLGLFLPIGSRVHVTYSGGYSTVPADLVRACKYLGAAYVIDELDPLGDHGHDPDVLRVKAADMLLPYMRE
jgi:hypothetical protein